MMDAAKAMEGTPASSRPRVLDFFELMKPELTFLSVLTALCGYYLATVAEFDLWVFVHIAIGTALVGGGASALNQYIERNFDALMKRTERRPLPSGRMSPAEGLLFGIAASVLGLVELTVFTNLLTGFLGFVTFASYLFLYTPLKRVTPFATLVGGIPGALPPVMGWTAVRNEITVEALVLFVILFCWQIPHFLSLAWMYRKDYARAGFKMLTVADERGIRTARQIVVYCLALVPATAAATLVGLAGVFYLIGTVPLGVFFLGTGVLFARSVSTRNLVPQVARPNQYSRRVFFASLLYLPVLLLLMTLDKV